MLVHFADALLNEVMLRVEKEFKTWRRIAIIFADRGAFRWAARRPRFVGLNHLEGFAIYASVLSGAYVMWPGANGARPTAALRVDRARLAEALVLFAVCGELPGAGAPGGVRVVDTWWQRRRTADHCPPPSSTTTANAEREDQSAGETALDCLRYRGRPHRRKPPVQGLADGQGYQIHAVRSARYGARLAALASEPDRSGSAAFHRQVARAELSADLPGPAAFQAKRSRPRFQLYSVNPGADEIILPTFVQTVLERRIRKFVRPPRRPPRPASRIPDYPCRQWAAARETFGNPVGSPPASASAIHVQCKAHQSAYRPMVPGFELEKRRGRGELVLLVRFGRFRRPPLALRAAA